MPVASTFGAVGAIALDVSGSDQDLNGRVARGVYVGGAGDVALLMDDGSTFTFVGCQAGMDYARQFTKVIQTGTTVTNSAILF